MKYNKGLVKIVESEEKDRCDTCNREVTNPIEISRNGRLIGRYGPKCAEAAAKDLIKANESSKFGVISEGMDFIDYFKRPTVTQIRKFRKKDLKGDRRTQVMDAYLRLKDGEYLNMPKTVELIPKVKNWRKKGDFIEVRLENKDRINYENITPKDAVKNYIGRDYYAYSGISYLTKSDNRYRTFSLMSLIEGRKIAYLCGKEEIKEEIEVESDQGPNKILWVPSTTDKGEYHRVILENLPVGKSEPYRAFEFDYSSTSGDAAFNNLPWSRRSLPRRKKFNEIRPDKFACAALEYLMNRADNDIKYDPRPVVPTNLACKLENRLLTRAVHDSQVLDGQDIEVQLWLTAARLGYHKMFE